MKSYGYNNEILWYYRSNETSSALGAIKFSTQFYLLSLWMKSYGVTIQTKPLQQYFHMVHVLLIYEYFMNGD